MRLVAIGVSYKTATLGLRERVELTQRATCELLTSLVSRPEVQEAAALCTCNRTELYLAAADPAAAAEAGRRALERSARLRGGELAAAIRTLDGIDAARHLFRVAAGLESMIVGEVEIQGQVRRSYELALSLGTSGALLNRLLRGALHAGKRVRSETGISRHAASVASVAVEIARRELGALEGRRALVIGAGKHGALAARALMDAGVQTVFVANRARERAEQLAMQFGGRAVGFDRVADELGGCDLVLTCTACPYRVISAAELAAASAGGRLVVVDTAVPRDVDPAARDLPGVALYDMDDIQREAARNMAARASEARRAEPVIEEEVARFGRWLASLEVVPTISALQRRGLATVERVVRENESRWRDLTAEDRQRVQLLARAVMTDLLDEPTRTLRRAGERGSSSLYVQTVRELFGLEA